MSSAPQLPVRGARRPAVAALTSLVFTFSGVAISQAQSSLPAGSPGRFTMHPADGGILRMDTQTGALSMCKQSSGSWACALLPDDKAALSDEIARLKSENSELKSAVKRLEDLAGVPSGPSEPGSGRQHSGVQLPTEEDVDKAMSYVERMLKRFKDKLKELEASGNQKGSQL